MIIACTGHRPDKLGGEWDLLGEHSDRIWNRMAALISEKKPSEIISGMALGVDTIWALVGLECKIPLRCYVPCDNYTAMWRRQSDKDRFNRICDQGTLTITGPGPYNIYKMQHRNKRMVDDCDLLLAVWNGSPGGTKNCVDYAREVGREVILFNPETA